MRDLHAIEAAARTLIEAVNAEDPATLPADVRDAADRLRVHLDQPAPAVGMAVNLDVAVPGQTNLIRLVGTIAQLLPGNQVRVRILSRGAPVGPFVVAPALVLRPAVRPASAQHP